MRLGCPHTESFCGSGAFSILTLHIEVGRRSNRKQKGKRAVSLVKSVAVIEYSGKNNRGEKECILASNSRLQPIIAGQTEKGL